jgi:hypothetical protein
MSLLGFGMIIELVNGFFFFFAVWLQNLNFVKSCIKISLLVCLYNLLVLIDVLSFSFDFSHR